MSLPANNGDGNCNGAMSDRAAERNVLGSMIRDNARIPDVARIVSPYDFSTDAHCRIANTIHQLHGDGLPADSVSIADELNRQNRLADIGGAVYLAELLEAAPTTANVEHHARIVKRKSDSRRLMRLGRTIARDADKGESAHEILERHAEEWRLLSDSTSGERGESDRFSFRDLSERFPTLRPAIIDGLIREAETANVISHSKIGKSWLAYSLALCVVIGRPWLLTFATTAGRVLLIDNELHRETLVSRIKAVASAMAIPFDAFADALEIWPLRGQLRDIYGIGKPLERIRPGTFKLIILDALYRLLPVETSENDNAAMARFYNQLDHYAACTGAAIVNVHHSTKGSQSDKRVTDVGAGAGAQARAADCHLILREHEENNVVVLDAAVRSFAPVEPLPLKWQFPLWLPDETIDASKLRGRLTMQDERQNSRDRQGMEAIIGELKSGPKTIRQIRRKIGMGDERCGKLLTMLEKDGKVIGSDANVAGNECQEFRLSKSE